MSMKNPYNTTYNLYSFEIHLPMEMVFILRRSNLLSLSKRDKCLQTIDFILELNDIFMYSLQISQGHSMLGVGLHVSLEEWTLEYGHGF
jgi:hypothetical protein